MHQQGFHVPVIITGCEEENNVNNVKFKEDLLKTRFYYGAGTDWTVSKNLKVFGYVEREHGSRYTKEIEVLAGVKYSF